MTIEEWRNVEPGTPIFWANSPVEAVTQDHPSLNAPVFSARFRRVLDRPAGPIVQSHTGGWHKPAKVHVHVALAIGDFNTRCFALIERIRAAQARVNSEGSAAVYEVQAGEAF
jgi:hypothetical protein